VAGGQGTDRSAGRSRPDGARREEEGDFEAALGRAWPRGTSLGKARGGSNAEVAGAGRCAGARATPRRPGKHFAVTLFERVKLQKVE
jgi:hypothetical protein